MSPYELKALLQQVLIAHDQVDMSPDESVIDISASQSNCNFINISAQSGGFAAGNFAKINILIDGKGF